jgi:hypothetical protein
MVMNKATILTEGYELPLNAFQLFGVTNVTEFHTFEA